MNYKKIKTWEDACKVNGVDPKKLPKVTGLPKKFQEWIIATYKLGVITEAINTDENGKIWTPDWNNSIQLKYFPYFCIKSSKNKPSGSGFSNSNFGGRDAISSVGSRLCFEKQEQVKHIQNHFKKLFIEFHLIQD